MAEITDKLLFVVALCHRGVYWDQTKTQHTCVYFHTVQHHNNKCLLLDICFCCTVLRLTALVGHQEGKAF